MNAVEAFPQPRTGISDLLKWAREIITREPTLKDIPAEKPAKKIDPQQQLAEALVTWTETGDEPKIRGLIYEVSKDPEGMSRKLDIISFNPPNSPKQR